MYISKYYMDSLIEGVIIHGNNIMPMKIRKTKDGIVLWDIGVTDSRSGELNHILMFEDYKSFERKGVSKAIYCTRSSIIKNKQLNNIINNSNILDSGTISYKIKGLRGHSYTEFDGFKTMNKDDKFVSTMRAWEFMEWLASSKLFMPIMLGVASLLTQDSSRIIRKF